MTPVWLYKLLDRANLSKWLKVGPEDVVNIAFADKCRVWSMEGRLRACWTHIPHEVGGGKGRLSQARYALANALGLVAGSGDMVFTWSDGSGWIEVKRPKGVTSTGKPAAAGRLNPDQVSFRKWCALHNVPYEVIYSADEGEAVLRKWGCLT